jgi:hypothetical protein
MAGDHRSGCAICGGELAYSPVRQERACAYCGTREMSEAACVNGHYVCNACHSGTANDLIERYCAAASSRDPLSMAMTLMKDGKVKMHGPEHHFLVPAVLLAAWANAVGKGAEERAALIATARRRAEEVKGGFCGFQGACGAAVGTGIFVSLATGATPVARAEWRLANLMTSESLRDIAEHGGPRCCKRDTFLALTAAVRFLARERGVTLDDPGTVVCSFSSMNRECLREACPYFAADSKGNAGTE